MSDDVNPYNAGSRVVPAATSPAGEDSLEVGFETQVEDKIAANDAHLQIFLDAARRFHRGGLGGGSETPFDRTP
jgi:hypothetical protein